jgi:hypothetical protein
MILGRFLEHFKWEAGKFQGVSRFQGTSTISIAGIAKRHKLRQFLVGNG